MNNYSERDINMMRYLGSQIECYLHNKLIQDKTETNILTTDILKPISETNKYFNNFYIENSSNKNATNKIRFYDASNEESSVNANTIVFNTTFFDSKRLNIIRADSQNIIKNITYSYDYLSEPKENLFIPQTFPTNKGEDVPLLYYLSFIAPKIYLEICSSYVNPFFVTLFQDYQNNIPVQSGQTLNTINSWCQNSNYIDGACGADKSNPRCACQKCYNNHSYQNRIIAQKLIGSDVSNTDPWCYYPQCAKGSAIKNQINVNRSVCSNLSVSGIFINPSEYSNVNISNTDVSASAYNNNGINITSNEGCNSCTSNQDCKIVNNNLTCVDKSSSVSQENKLGGKSSNVPVMNRVYFILAIIIGVFIVITVAVSFIFHKIPIVKFISTPIIIILIILCSIMIYLNRTSEDFTFPDYFTNTPSCDKVGCYSDIDCNNQAINGQVCIYNECSVPIGSFVTQGKITDYPYINKEPVKNCVITNLLHAPESIYTGGYFYLTFINNTLYAFAEHCTLSFDGIKWVEKAQKNGQLGFNPYSPTYIPTNFDTTIDNNFVYNNNIYLVNSNEKGLIFDVYNTLNDSWDILEPIKELDGSYKNYAIGIDDSLLYIYDSSTQYLFIYDIYKNTYTKNKSKVLSYKPQKLLIFNNTLFFIAFSQNSFYIYNWDLNKNDIELYYNQNLTYQIQKIVSIDNGQIELFVYNSNTPANIITFSISDKKFNTPVLINSNGTDTEYFYSYLVCRNNKYTFIMAQTGEIYRLHLYQDSSGFVFNLNICYVITNFDVPKNFPIEQI